MRILLTGALGAHATDMIPRFQREGHSVSLLGEWTPARDEVTDVSCYRMNPRESYAQRMVEAARYDVIVFLYSCRSESLNDSAAERGAMLDALWELTTTAQRSGLKHFILVTDRRVFGAGQNGSEDELPVPDTTAGVMNSAAEDCVTHCAQSTFKSLIIRVNSLYAPNRMDCLLAELITRGDAREPYMMPYAEGEACGFLRAEDLADFICLAINRELSGIAHLTDGAPCDYAKVVERVAKERPKLNVSWPAKPDRSVTLKPGRVVRLGWAPSHKWDEELRLIVPDQRKEPQSFRHRLGKPARRIAPVTGALLLAAALHCLYVVGGEGAFVWCFCAWMLYVAAIAVINGIWPGLGAAALACVSFITENISKNAFGELPQIAQIWLPIGAYLLVGVLFGAMHEHRGRKLQESRREQERLEEEEKLLDVAWQHADEEMDRLERQAQSAPDSYGRIYGIARELDSLQPEQVLLSTLGVIEDVLQSDRVAIYYCKANDAYARLALNSRGMWLPKSLTLSEPAGLTDAFERGEAYSSDDCSPALAVPICHEGSYVAMIALWDKADKVREPYYLNLFSITCGLVESALARAMHHLRYASDVYVSGTHLLSSKYFLSACRSFEDMKRLGRGDYLLLRVTGEDAPGIDELDRRLGAAARSTDICGCMNDEGVFALLPQADEAQLSRIAVRFAKHKLLCSAIDAADCLEKQKTAGAL